ncbi:tetratricopeptide repeat protein [Streptacidiphilus carbonis]|uniref:tetratricopeptide repeat protein n=1 Tax=Streptacidiphilus carbonis TaxID=105422 RepID=UPI0005A67F22|nr:tetratricopeptide repeat protein [Streptacidiphilus carbonis]
MAQLTATADDPAEPPPAPSSAPARIGELLDGRWSVTGIRQGGQGWVLIVDDHAQQVRRAIKVPMAGALIGDGELAMLLGIAPHPHVIAALDEVMVGDRCGVLLEYLPATLEDLLRQHHSAGPAQEFTSQAPPLNEGISLVLQHLCTGLAYLSDTTETAHLDLKPSNVLVDESGRAKVADFGLAQAVRIQDGRFPTARGGTWAYAAPEVLRLDPCDARADVFSFGVLLYQACTGLLPYPFELAADSRTQREQLLAYYASDRPGARTKELYYATHPLAAEVPRWIPDTQLRILLSMCLQEIPENRPTSFSHLGGLLDRALGRPRPQAEPTVLTDDDRRHRQATLARVLRRLGRLDESLDLLNELLTQPLPGELQSAVLQAARDTLRAAGRHADAAALEDY